MRFNPMELPLPGRTTDHGPLPVHALYVRCRLPIRFDIQCMEWESGSAPERTWDHS